VLHPISSSFDDCLWQAVDGAKFDTAGLAAHCARLLENQIKAGSTA
jgi:hypothetical protein